jgi:hypothetical protein
MLARTIVVKARSALTASVFARVLLELASVARNTLASAARPATTVLLAGGAVVVACLTARLRWLVLEGVLLA